MTFSIRKAVSLFVFLAATPLATLGAARSEEEFRLSDLYRDPVLRSNPPASTLRRGDTLSRGLDALLGGRPLPIPCATSLILEARRHRDALPDATRDALRVVSQRPSLSRDESHLTRDGRFRIHFTVDAASPDALPGEDDDLNGVPDRIDQIESALDRAGLVLVEEMGWPRPASGPRADRYDVYLVSLGSPREGFTSLDREIPGTPGDDASSHLVIDSKLEGPALAAAVVHQYAHASLLGLSTRSPAWWTEGTAAWMEMQVTADPAAHEGAIRRRLERLDASLQSDSLPLCLGNYLWFSYLADRLDGNPELIRRIWQESSLRGSEPVTSLLDDLLGRIGQDSLDVAFREFTRWTLFTGPGDDGNHFRMGSLLPAMVPRATHPVFPVESAGPDAIEPLGASVYRFVGDGGRGGLRIRFDAEAPASFEVDLVIRPTGGASPHLVELIPDQSGHAEAGIPWREVREAFLIVRNTAREGPASRFRYSAQIDPTFPFDLSSFSAVAGPGGVTLLWSTARETELLGWNVYRSVAPGGAFVRLNPLALPSSGDSPEETDYIYQDGTAADGHRYFYLVEGITVHGLPERTFPLSARIPEPESVP